MHCERKEKGGVTSHIVICFLLAFPAAAHEISRVSSNEQINSQQQRQKALEQRLDAPLRDVHLLQPVIDSGLIFFPHEDPCFRIDRVELEELEEKEKLPDLAGLQKIANQATGKCLGGDGLNLLMSTMQNRLIEQGYITSRVTAPGQNLKSGTLKLQVKMGKTGKVKFAETSKNYIQLYNNVPVHEGKWLNLRDIEQGLENLQRLPDTQANMKIVPGEKPGESDVEVSWQQKRIWRLGLFIDDSASVGIGRYQGGISLSLDNPLSLGDLFYFAGSHNFPASNKKKNQNLTVHYSFPLGYWMVGLNAYNYHYIQQVAGTLTDFQYSGRVKNLDGQISRVIQRGRDYKTTIFYNLIARESNNYIEDFRLPEQRRRTIAWRLGIFHRRYIGQNTLDALINYQQGSRWFGALPAPEEKQTRATASGKTAVLNLRLNMPFTLASQRFRFYSNFHQQITRSALTSPEQLSIGNR